jgi:hypothetical protein
VAGPVRDPKVRRRLLSTLACALLFLHVAPPAAMAQGTPTNPFAPFPQPTTSATQTQPSVVTQVNTTSTTGNGSLSGGGAIAVGAGAAIVLGGISFFIWHDARRRAPVRRRAAAAAAAGAGSRPGSKRVKPRKLSPAERRRRKRGRAR